MRYLSHNEEKAVKENIVWENIDAGIRELVLLINRIDGIVTLQSCAGHVRPSNKSEMLFDIQNSMICVRTTREIMNKILFYYAPKYIREDVSIRYFNDGAFWISLEAEPSQNWRLYKLFRELFVEESAEVEHAL